MLSYRNRATGEVSETLPAPGGLELGRSGGMGEHPQRMIGLATAPLFHLNTICPFLPLTFFSFSKKNLL
jgi:hypothetical protein